MSEAAARPAPAGRRVRLVAAAGRCIDAADRFAWETVQWQRSAASAVYLMALNAAFWLCAFYLRRDYQLGALRGLAAVLCLGELVYVAKVASRFSPNKAVDDVKSDWKHFKESSLVGQLLQCAFFVATLAPLRFLLRPFACELRHLICDKFDHVLLSILCASSAHHLQRGGTESAAWLAYAAAVTAASGPAWRHYEVTPGVVHAARVAVLAVASWFYTAFVAPVGRLLHAAWRFIRYYLFFEWVPPLVYRIKRGIDAVKYFVRTKVTEPIGRFVHLWTSRALRLVRRVKDFVVYWLGGYWIRPLKQWIREQWLLPVGVHITRLKNAIVYAVCGHWIPPLLIWIRATVVDPTVAYSLRVYAAFKALCRRALSLALYILLGYWLVDLARLLLRATISLARYARRQWLVPLYRHSLRCKADLVAHVKEHVLAPLLVLAKRCARSSAAWLDRSVLRPALLSMYLAASDLCALAHKNVLVPVWLVAEVHLRRTKLYLWLNYGEPFCEWVQSKMPAQDDSDIRDFMPSASSQRVSTRASVSPKSESEGELYDDLLPTDVGGGGELDAVLRDAALLRRPNSKTGHPRGSKGRLSSSRGKKSPSPASAAGLTPGNRSESNSARSSMHDRGRCSDTGDEELDDFVHGLKFNSRATKDSDSSDDEFSLRPVVRAKNRRRRHVGDDHAHEQPTPVSEQVASPPPQLPDAVEPALDATHTSASSLEQSQGEARLAHIATQHPPAPVTMNHVLDVAASPPTRLDSRADRSASPPSEASWSDTLLAAYKRTGKPASAKRPPSAARGRTGVGQGRAQVESHHRDDEGFEILDKHELDSLY